MFTLKSLRVDHELFWLSESKQRLKQKFKKIGMAALVFITICEYKLSKGSLSFREMSILRYFCLKPWFEVVWSSVTAQGWTEESWS